MSFYNLEFKPFLDSVVEEQLAARARRAAAGEQFIPDIPITDLISAEKTDDQTKDDIIAKQAKEIEKLKAELAGAKKHSSKMYSKARIAQRDTERAEAQNAEHMKSCCGKSQVEYDKMRLNLSESEKEARGKITTLMQEKEALKAELKKVQDMHNVLALEAGPVSAEVEKLLTSDLPDAFPDPAPA